RPPIAYSLTEPDNPIARLQAAVDRGSVQLEFQEPYGYLTSVLTALEVPVSSQMLVFSKTSLQRQRISPRTPRAIYFNDDVYIGYCRSGEVVEVAVADPQLGTVFYTLDQAPQDRPMFVRQTDNCLLCHGGSQTRGVPGHLVRSVYPDSTGQPILASGSYKVDHATPLKHRWGGWYVTGTHGEQTHLGNLTYHTRPNGDGPGETTGLNVTDLTGRFTSSGYLSSHSDLIALMTMEHQAGGHNALVRAAFDVRAALYREDALNRELKEPEDHRWDSTNSILNGAADSLVKYFLFAGEAPLTAPLHGTSSFAAEFAARGPRDAAGRSLREFDLQTRLFRYPCSYLIYSDSFDALPGELREKFWEKLDDVLSGRNEGKEFAHLSPEDRAAIREILAATKSGAPAMWGTSDTQ
ncbi:MAG TPA: hypothetical protein VM165_01275, partial [Planctomycetaceae bacterium]|nr:hypothetical protein [Planctomycetaceae bacterium]